MNARSLDSNQDEVFSEQFRWQTDSHMYLVSYYINIFSPGVLLQPKRMLYSDCAEVITWDTN